MKWYVYTLTNSRTGEIFYVGKGQQYRMYAHYLSVKRNKVPNNNYKLFRKIKDIIDSGSSITYSQPLFTDNEKEAYEFERKLISEIGLDSLCNLTSGGGGINTHVGRKHWNFGNHWSDEVKRKISESKKGQFHSTESKNKIKQYWKKVSHPMKGKSHTTEARMKMSKNHADFRGPSNPFFGKHHSEEVKELYRKLYSKKWEITLPTGEVLSFLGKKEVISYINEYNEKYNTKISAHSLFQYGRNKHNWTIKTVMD